MQRGGNATPTGYPTERTTTTTDRTPPPNPEHGHAPCLPRDPHRAAPTTADDDELTFTPLPVRASDPIRHQRGNPPDHSHAVPSRGTRWLWCGWFFRVVLSVWLLGGGVVYSGVGVGGEYTPVLYTFCVYSVDCGAMMVFLLVPLKDVLVVALRGTIYTHHHRA